MSAKCKHRDKLVKYLGNPDNEIKDREFLAIEVLGFKRRQALHNTFTADELKEIEMEALAIRRKAYALALAKVDEGLLRKAAEGDAAAAKLAYQRFEGWSEKIGVSIDQLDRLIESELAKLASDGEAGHASEVEREEQPEAENEAADI